jgi:hypothetical protein
MAGTVVMVAACGGRGRNRIAPGEWAERSMVSLARGWFTQGCAASDGRGFTLGSA